MRKRGKQYASLETLRHLRRSGFAVIEEGSLFDPKRTYWWHRVEGRARERVRRLRSQAHTAYFVRLAERPDLSQWDKTGAASQEK